ncbi:NADH dehydrogenase [ubiquinone] 1 beta subcomplex subunit 2, mitochondrial isoform X2 [Astatotilapia calliptera]|uniref:NADH dehydrogenase [ubiquinone] 1 beta subcomplex subunit 2, mitochondrial n=1 Tax=Astatotilapia calliptera TaxID=8154 RepID=A0AAX7VBN7_ASTCA|nr:NADH dehydrogenase [ubiquinone] 1 beta subcomplex subunit 2, mitochondrial isoform X2 [Astatotilapia calliptera]XP_039891448.1 NADH dehydrogenase [ubiquinone] 1 beta subcomplex subunit 2, mitochondrial isoform X2 [Simochromis diagramma]
MLGRWRTVGGGLAVVHKQLMKMVIFEKWASGGPHIEPQYRQYPQLTKKQKFESELISGVMWFWILWHCWHDPDAVLGHFPWPDASEWTDEELGIPPDDEE